MDYETLRFVWWVLIGVLLVGFAVTDGFDMGVAALLNVVGRGDEERRVMINSMAPHWDDLWCRFWQSLARRSLPVR